MRPWKLWADVRLRYGWLAGAAVVGLLVVAIAAAEIAGWPFLAGPAQRALERQLGVAVQLEAPFALHLIGRPRLALGSLRVAAAAPSTAPFLLDADRVELRWRWADLWRYRQGETLRLARLQAGRLEAHLQRNEKGEASWQFKPPKAGDTAPPALPHIDVLRVADGLFHVDDAPLALRLEVTAHLDENRKDAAAGGLFVSAQGSYRGAPARGQAHAATPLELAGSDADAAAQPLSIDVGVGATRLVFDGHIVDVWGQQSFEGTLKLNGPSLAAVGAPFGITLPTTPPFALRGHLGRSEGVWRLDAYDATVGRSRVNGEFSFDPRPKLPVLNGSLRGQRLALADLAPAIGAPAAAASAASAAAGAHVLPQRSFDLPSLRQMDAHVAVALDELDLGSAALDTLRPLKAKLALESGVLSLSGIDTHTAGGALTGSTQLDGNSSPATWRADVRWQGVDLAGWIKGVRTGDAKVNARSAKNTLAREREAALENTEPVHAYITGEMRGEAKMTGRGNSTAQILATLDGTARATLRDGTLSHLAVEVAGIDVAQAFGVAVRGDRSLPLSCAVVAFRSRSGVLTPEVAVFDTPDSTITAQGQIDLRNEQLNLRAIVHPKDFSFFSLRSPLLVQGTFSAPSVRLETGPLAGRLLAGTALAAVNPFAALAAFIDPGDKGTAGCAEVAQRAARQTGSAPASNPTKTTITRSSP